MIDFIQKNQLQKKFHRQKVSEIFLKSAYRCDSPTDILNFGALLVFTYCSLDQFFSKNSRVRFSLTMTKNLAIKNGTKEIDESFV